MEGDNKDTLKSDNKFRSNSVVGADMGEFRKEI